MRNKDNTERNKTTITAHLEMMLMILTLATVAFFAGHYVAAMQIAAMLAN